MLSCFISQHKDASSYACKHTQTLLHSLYCVYSSRRNSSNVSLSSRPLLRFLGNLSQNPSLCLEPATCTLRHIHIHTCQVKSTCVCVCVCACTVKTDMKTRWKTAEKQLLCLMPDHFPFLLSTPLCVYVCLSVSLMRRQLMTGEERERRLFCLFFFIRHKRTNMHKHTQPHTQMNCRLFLKPCCQH